MTSEWAISGKFDVGRYSCEMTVGPGGVCCEWSPEMPPAHGLTAKEIKQYKRGRKKLVDQLAARMGGPVLIFDI